MTERSGILFTLAGLASAVAVVPAGACGKGPSGAGRPAAQASKAVPGHPRAGAFDSGKLLPGLMAGPAGYGKTSEGQPGARLLTLAADTGNLMFQREVRRRPVLGKFTQGIETFFIVRSTDEVGLVTVLRDCPGLSAPPRSFLTTRDGWLLWLSGNDNTVHAISPTQGYIPIPVETDTRLKTLLLDPEGKVHYFGEATCGTLAPPALTDPGDPDLAFESTYRPWAGPEAAVPGAGGDLWGSSGTCIFRIQPGRSSFDTLECKNFATATAMAFDPGTDSLCWVNPGQDKVSVVRGGGRALCMPLAAGSRPQGIILGPDGLIWVTLGGRDEIAIINPADGRKKASIMLARSEKLAHASRRGPLGPHGISNGSDGNVWVTLKAANLIVRITPDFDVTPFALPFGKDPADICASHDGRMLFSLADAGCLGAITAKPQVIPDYRGIGKADDEPAAILPRSEDPSRDGRKVSRAERHRLHDEQIRQAEARGLARLSAAAEAAAEAPAEEEDEASYLPSGPEPAEGKAESGTAPASYAIPLRPVDRLARINVFLTADRVRHVHKFHAYGKDATKSQFAEQHSSKGRLRELLARALEKADRTGVLGRVIDGDGACLTYCDLGEPIGWYNSGDGTLTATRWIRVVTARSFNPDTGADEHYLYSFYPDREPW